MVCFQHISFYLGWLELELEEEEVVLLNRDAYGYATGTHSLRPRQSSKVQYSGDGCLIYVIRGFRHFCTLNVIWFDSGEPSCFNLWEGGPGRYLLVNIADYLSRKGPMSLEFNWHRNKKEKNVNVKYHCHIL